MSEPYPESNYGSSPPNEDFDFNVPIFYPSVTPRNIEPVRIEDEQSFRSYEAMRRVALERALGTVALIPIVYGGSMYAERAAAKTEAELRAERAADAAKSIDNKFVRTLHPIVEALRGEPAHARKVEQALEGPSGASSSRYLISEALLSNQRSLMDWEKRQVETMAPLSATNSYQVAASRAPEITGVCLDSHFDRLSDQTHEKYPDGSFSTMTVIGAGVHAVVAAGQIMRERPDLMADTVFMDKQHVPGGPFAYPNGKAWSLNSSSYRGPEPFALPSANTYPGAEQGVRATGGILRWYPGERNDPNKPRSGSINRLVEYFPAPDEGSADRYEGNDVLAGELKKQAAALMDNFMGDTEVISVEQNGDIATGGSQGSFKLTLRVTKGDTVSYRTHYTDELFVASGNNVPLQRMKRQRGEEGYVEWSRIARKSGRPSELPAYSSGLEPYRWFADRSKEEKIKHGSRFIILGDGNSAETELEMLAGLLAEEGNFDISKIEKITIVGPRAKERIGNRRRYKMLLDTLERNGRSNLVDLVDARATRLDAFDATLRDIFVRDENGLAILNDRSNVVAADHIFEATGFEEGLPAALQPLITNGVAVTKIPVRLPTNADIVVGESLAGYSNISLVGTVSRPSFNEAKRLQLPESSEEVLAGVSENVVAIGFRAPDTQVAVSEHLKRQELALPIYDGSKIETEVTGKTLSMELAEESVVSAEFKPREIAIDSRVTADSALMTPLLLAQLSTHRLADRGKHQFVLDIKQTADGVSVLAPEGSAIPASVMDEVLAASQNSYFAAYSQKALRERRGSTKIQVHMSYIGGRLRLNKSFVQAA